jgi:menaquinone-dependent protoporphyrinogen oxidase
LKGARPVCLLAQATERFAGALKYTRYSWLKRMLMKHIAEKEGGDVDTSRDFEYTDWEQVTRFAERFFAALDGAPVSGA